MNTIEELIASILIVVVMVAFVFMMVWVGVSLSHESKCLGAGYSNSSTGLLMDGYCISTIDGSEFVVPVEDI